MFEQLHPNMSGRYNAEDVYNVWGKAESILRNKIDASDKFIEEYIQDRENAVRTLQAYFLLFFSLFS